jgi:hypothetical protein
MRSINPFRLLLSFLLLFGLSWLCSDRLDELRYFFIGQPLVVLGNVLDLKNDQLHDGQYVEVSGVLGNRAATITGIRSGSFRYGSFQIRHLLGSPIFVEFDQSRAAKEFDAYRQVTVKGRLTDFGPQSEMKCVREFFETRLKMQVPEGAKLLVIDEAPRQGWRYPVMFMLAIVLTLASFWFSLRGLWAKP